jgi:hypothetical protein
VNVGVWAVVVVGGEVVVVVVVGVAFVVVGGVVVVVAGSTLVVVSRADVVVGSKLVLVVITDVAVAGGLKVVVDIDDLEQPMPVTSRDKIISVIVAALKGLFIPGFPISTRSEPTPYLFSLDTDDIPSTSGCKA